MGDPKLELPHRHLGKVCLSSQGWWLRNESLFQ